MQIQNNKEINIALVSDENYIQHLAVTVVSVLENTSAKTRFYVLTDNSLSEQSRLKIEWIIKNYNSSVQFITVSTEQFKSYPIPSYIPVLLYSKFLIPQLLPELEKIICLDIDIVVRKNIAELWNESLDEYAVGACCDLISPKRVEHLHISHSDYYNAGVQLMDLTKMKVFFENTFHSILNDHISSQIFRHDQDLFNMIFHGRWKRLHQRWNCMASLNPAHKAKYGYNRSEMIQALKDPAIIHYTTSKPWNYNFSGAWRKEYWKYLNLTPYKGYRCSSRNFHDILRKYTPKLLRKILPPTN